MHRARADLRRGARARKAEHPAHDGVQPRRLHRKRHGTHLPLRHRHSGQLHSRRLHARAAHLFQFQQRRRDARQAEHIRAVLLHENVADPLAPDAETEDRAEIVPVAGCAERRRKVHGAQVLCWVKVLGRKVKRQEKRRPPLTARAAAVQHERAVTVAGPVRERVLLRRRQKRRGRDRRRALAALGQIGRAAQKIFLHCPHLPLMSRMAASSCCATCASSCRNSRALMRSTPARSAVSWMSASDVTTRTDSFLPISSASFSM